MYTNTWIKQNAENRMMSNFILDTLTYHDGIFFPRDAIIVDRFY